MFTVRIAYLQLARVNTAMKSVSVMISGRSVARFGLYNKTVYLRLRHIELL